MNILNLCKAGKLTLFVGRPNAHREALFEVLSEYRLKQKQSFTLVYLERQNKPDISVLESIAKQLGTPFIVIAVCSWEEMIPSYMLDATTSIFFEGGHNDDDNFYIIKHNGKEVLSAKPINLKLNQQLEKKG